MPTTRITTAICLVLIGAVSSCNVVKTPAVTVDTAVKTQVPVEIRIAEDVEHAAPITRVTNRESARTFAEYKTLYGVDCVQEKITDNKGEGFENLYGTRNFRAVLHGVAYRGGGNNYYHRSDKRNNKNPLPMDGLQALLDNGFSTSVYLYKENFASAPEFLVNAGSMDTLQYYQLGGNTPSELDSLLMFTYRAIQDETVGPVYLHCWNGWHQSGYVSAVLLKQFCDFDAEKSIHYWEDCADNWSRGYDRIRHAIKVFTPLDKYAISDEVKASICPCYNDIREGDVINIQPQEVTTGKSNTTLQFPTSVSDLPPSVSTFLDQYAEMMKENPFISVEVEGHTDAVGNDFANMELSASRANNVYRYLIQQGVDSTHLTFQGYGEKHLLNRCADGVNCSNEEHALNRRIQFTVTDISQQINFEKGSNVISPDDKLILVKIGRYLREFKDTTIEIGGHADGGSGTEFVNNNISALRAERVFEFLKKNGFDVENLTHHGYGASQPIYHDVRDRRIEFLVHHNKRSK